MSCVICGGPTSSMRLVLERSVLDRCAACGHARTARAPAHTGHESYAITAGARDRYERDYLPGRIPAWRRGLDRLEALNPGRLLDVGCNYGHFLREARDYGWDVTGVEPGERLRAAALDAVADRVVGSVAEAAGRGPYSAITLWDVLEHVDDPGPFLDELVALLAPDGRMLVRVPDARALAVGGVRGQLYLTLCHPTNPEEHPHHYSPQSLRLLAQARGLGVEDVLEARPDERVVSGWTAADRLLRRRMHSGAGDRPYEFTAVLRASV